MICSGWGTGSARRSKPLTILNVVVFTAIPSPSVTIAMIAKLGEFRSARIAYFMSCQKLCMVSYLAFRPDALTPRTLQAALLGDYGSKHSGISLFLPVRQTSPNHGCAIV